jgi:hypothetical protein
LSALPSETDRLTEIEVGGPCGKLDPKHQQGKKMSIRVLWFHSFVTFC